MKKLMFLSFLVSLFVFESSFANTFVGNGGNSTDVELQVTLLQIKKVLADVQSHPTLNQELCTCSESLEGHKICENLKALNVEQKNYCQNQLVGAASEMLNLLQSSSGIQIVWTLETIQVSEKAGLREAEAVANTHDLKIYLNRDAFLNLKDYERIYLLSHELGHFIPFARSQSPRQLKDDEQIGPFKQSDGSRQFLNSLGSAIAMKSLDTGVIDEYKASLRRSKTYRTNWFNVSATSESERKDTSSFAIKNYSGAQFEYRYQILPELGFSVGYRQLKGKETFFEVAKTESLLQLWNAKINYRLIPFSNPLSFWGQSHFVFGAGFEKGKAQMDINDGYTSAHDEAQLSSGILSAHYYLPVLAGFWIQTGLVATSHQYEFNQIGFKSQNNQVSYELGVSYGF